MLTRCLFRFYLPSQLSAWDKSLYGSPRQGHLGTAKVAVWLNSSRSALPVIFRCFKWRRSAESRPGANKPHNEVSTYPASMSVSELKKILGERGVSYADCIEKSDLIARVKETAGRPGQITKTIKHIGGSDCVVFQNSPNPEVVLILAHGYGANKDDFAPIIPIIAQLLRDKLPPILVALPDAPIAVDGQANRRGWWKIDFQHLFASYRSGTVTKHIPDGLHEANTNINNLISTLQHQYNLPLSRFILSGFSQGAILSCDVALRLPQNVGGVLLLSGSFVAEDEWAKHAASHKGLRVFQSHGRNDMVLPFGFAERLHQFLKSHGIAAEFRPFDGGHHMVPELYQSIADLIVDVSKTPKQ